MSFSTDYFHFWPTAIGALFVQTSSLVARGSLYGQEITAGIVFEGLFTVFWLFMNLLGTHIILEWIGMIFVKSESIRIGNENLLNGLEEGVVILDEDTTNVHFLNKAAKAFKIKMNENFSMQLMENDEEINQSHKQFTPLDMTVFKQASDSAKIWKQISQLDDHVSL